ncbi:hypothetical protein OAT67_07970, partial [Bacteriovoracaceae bacterium]|nr:hypothetical protein [Bacteriovoracaceae bacterium]
FTQSFSIYAELPATSPSSEVASDTDSVSSEEPELNDRAAENDNLLEQNTAHEQESIEAGGTTTACRTRNSAAQQQYEDIIAFEQTYLDQNFAGIQDQMNNLDDQTRDMASTQAAVNGTAGENHMAREKSERLANDRADALAKYNQAKARRKELLDPPDNSNRFNTQRGIIPSLSSQVSSLASQCAAENGGCSQARRAELARLRSVLADRRSEYRIVRNAEIEEKRRLDRIDREIRSNEDNITNAGDAVSNQTALQADANAISGCNASEGTTCNLSGSQYQEYERLNQMVNATTESAARLARVQTEKANELALQLENKEDYRLFELALDDFDPNHSAEYITSNGFSGHRMAMSNLEVMAYVGAATKNLRCTPEVTGPDGADSRAYHIFRAASATFLMAQMNDTNLYSDTSQCRAYEDFTEDDRDTQFRTVQRAANLHTEVFENLCLRINPSDAALKERCDEYLKDVLGEEYIDKPRTRESALAMFKDAWEVAMQEVTVKNKRINDAHANVMKGEAWIDEDTSIITTMVGLVAITTTLASIFDGLIGPCCAAFGSCCGMAVGGSYKFHWLQGVYYGILTWYGYDLIRARNFTAEWRRKLALAKKYTHLECNYAAAKGEQDSNDAYIARKAQEAREAVEKARQDVLDSIYKDNQTQETPPTGESNSTGFFDQTINQAIKKQMASASNEKEALLLSYEWTRHQNGALSSLPYNTVAPKKDLVEYALSKKGFSLEKKALEMISHVGTELVTPAHATSDQGTFNADMLPSLGLATGSSSFSYFLAKRNKAWQDFAFDAGTLDGVRIDMNALYVNANNLRPVEKTGFPVPETRVTTIQNMYELVLDNINQMDMGIAEAAAQMDAYIVLLNEMRQRMNLGDQGLDDTEVAGIDFTKGKCLKTDGGGQLTMDEDCDCKLTSSCAEFSYPQFDAFVPNANTANGAIGEDFATATAKGQAFSTSVTTQDADNNSIKLSKAIKDRQNELNKQAKANSTPPRDFDKEAADYLNASRKDTYNQYKKQSPALAEYESKKGLFRFNNADQLASTKKVKKELTDEEKKALAEKKALEEKIAALNKGKKSGSDFAKKMAALKADLAKKKAALANQDVMANLKELDDSDVPTFDAASLVGINNQVQEDDGNQGRYKHQRRPASTKKGYKNKYNTGIAGRNQNLFQVISKRYERTAFPIFDIQ